MKGNNTMSEAIKKLEDNRIIPAVSIKNADDAIPTMKALLKGGISVAEIMFREAAAEEAIKRITSEIPEALIGAGTVLNVEQADRAINAGAKFIVAPGFNPEVVKYVMDKGVLMVPGVMTPTEIELALSYGLDRLKFFPAEAAGGINVLKAFGGPYPSVKFLPTGGVNLNNINGYLDCKNVFAIGGTWIAKKEEILARQFDEITKAAEEAVQIIR